MQIHLMLFASYHSWITCVFLRDVSFKVRLLGHRRHSHVHLDTHAHTRHDACWRILGRGKYFRVHAWQAQRTVLLECSHFYFLCPGFYVGIGTDMRAFTLPDLHMHGYWSYPWYAHMQAELAAEVGDGYAQVMHAWCAHRRQIVTCMLRCPTCICSCMFLHTSTHMHRAHDRGVAVYCSSTWWLACQIHKCLAIPSNWPSLIRSDDDLHAMHELQTHDEL